MHRLDLSLYFHPKEAFFPLQGWCMLDVFSLPAFTRLGHECVDLLSLCNKMHLCTDWPPVYTLTRKRFVGMESETMLVPRKKTPSTESSEEDQTHDAASDRTVSPTHY